jgi:hypothetical protein
LSPELRWGNAVMMPLASFIVNNVVITLRDRNGGAKKKPQRVLRLPMGAMLVTEPLGTTS